MKKITTIPWIYPSFLLLFIPLVFASCFRGPKQFERNDALPSIFPDYTGIVIPYNIAPLNFHVDIEGDRYIAKISSENGDPIITKSKNGSIKINIKKWRRLLKENKENPLLIDVFVKDKGVWTKYQTITNTISADAIDSHLTYRLINNGYVLWREMGIYQRDLESFREYPILENKSVDYACMNCHSFAGNKPDKMSLHIRLMHGGTVIVNGDEIRKIETNTEHTLSAAAYPSWHPNGTHVAYSTNTINQKFTSEEGKIRQVIDGASDIVIYDAQKNLITTSPLVSSPDRENLPVWNAQGNALFYISAPKAINDSIRVYAKYSLLSIPYCTITNQWGTPDTLINANKTGYSVTFPKASPDGRYLLFTKTEYGYFTIYFKDANIYIMDLETKEYWKLDVNSDYTDSYHSWSANSKWFVFSSKRIDGAYTRPFFAHIDSLGSVSKPFPMPQQDPLYYRSYLLNYNVPQLVDGRVTFSARNLRDAVRQPSKPVIFDPSVDVDALSGATQIEPSLHD
jgi:hypothetical protein